MQLIHDDVSRPPDSILAGAEVIHTEDAVHSAMDRMAEQVTAVLQHENPIVLAVMTGGMVPAVWLCSRLKFPHQIDYVHATRYIGTTRGGELQWRVEPRLQMSGRSVLIVDDILDEGITLDAVAQHCRALGAAEVRVAVLVRKQHARNRTDMRPDFVGLEVPDRYVFGCGMDYEEYFRNMPAIYALAAEESENG
jgi:hypoxanthine phosphoribosyltransferase